MSLETQWKTSLKHGGVWNPCLKLFQTRMQILLICKLIRQQKHEAIKNSDLITHFTKQTLNLNYLRLTLNVTAHLKLPKTEKPIRFLNFKLSLNGGNLVFWFTFNLAVDFLPKMALTLEILSDQMHTLPRNSAVHTIFLFFASFRRSKYKSALPLICFAKQRVRSELTNKLGNNVISVDEYSKIVTAQQLGDRIMHISRLKYNSWIVRW